MQWIVAPTLRRLPVLSARSTPVTPACHPARRPGTVMNSQATCGGALVGTDTPKAASSAEM
jgi:hypothetical protein